MRPTSLAFSLLLPAFAAAKHHGSNVVSSFKWQRPLPYDNSAPLGMNSLCEVSRTFRGEQHKLRDLQASPGSTTTSPWEGPVQTYLGWHPYVGSWDGVDEGGDERDLIIMDYASVPLAVREWVEDQHAGRGKNDKSRWWLYGVFNRPKKDFGKAGGLGGDHKILLFAPAALYEILPLWVGEDSGCEIVMLDLSKYSAFPRDNSVIAWPVEHEVRETKRGKRQDLSFTIKAFYVTETDDGKTWREMWEKLHIQNQRQARKEQRDQRKAARETVGRGKDEL